MPEPMADSIGRRKASITETINGLYKAESIRTTVFHDGPYKTIADVEYGDPQPRAATRIRAAENLRHFKSAPDADS